MDNDRSQPQPPARSTPERGPTDPPAANQQCTTPDPLFFTVAAPCRLLEYLLESLPDLSRGSARRLLAAGAVRVGGLPQTAGYRLQAGQVVGVQLPAVVPLLVPEPIPVDIVYEDDLLLAIHKPPGMLVHPTSRERTGTVANALRHYLSLSGHTDARPRFLHRLDRLTSGLLLAAKPLPPRSPLARMFESRLVEKTYVAVVEGRPARSEFTVTAPVRRDPLRIPQWNIAAPAEPGQYAETHFRLLDAGAKFSLLEARPVTGRTNQIRIHLAASGLPIRGDTAYGAQPAPRLYLHSVCLRFQRSPEGNLRLECPPGPEFSQLD